MTGIPDIQFIIHLNPTVCFSLPAGDFLEVYSDPEHFESRDCVVTCFFIDCAHNILDFIQLIHKILRPGGKWINLGRSYLQHVKFV